MGSSSSKPITRSKHDAPILYEKLVSDSPRKTLDALDTRMGNLDIKHAPTSEDGTITLSQLRDWESTVSSDSKLQLTRTILTHADIPTALVSRQAKTVDTHVFNTSLNFQTNPITSQNSSGRCWLFATTNVLRYSVMKRLGLQDFQLSQSYLFIYDKLEKANYYLELSIRNADLPIDDRRVYHAAQSPVGDGGQWDMACNLLQTYGLVPRDVFPESFSSGSSKPLNNLVTNKLREDALILRRLASQLRSSGSISESSVLSTLRSKKEELMRDIWVLVSTTLGAPPRPDEEFTWDYIDKHEKAHTWRGTPLEFFKSFTSNQYPATKSFSLINDPRNEYGKLYTVESLGNIWGGRPVLYVNTESDRLKDHVIKMIKAGQPVFFGSDVGKHSDRQLGILDTELHEYENAFNIKLGMTKSERLQTGESAMTHAMVISAVHIDAQSGRPVRYKVENSWGPDVGNKGYFVMTDKWFDEFVYQVVVPNSLADQDLLEVFEKGDKITLPPWDPMGALA